MKILTCFAKVAGLLLLAASGIASGEPGICPNWFLIRSGTKDGVKGTVNDYKGEKSFINTNIFVQGDLLDIRVNHPVIHNDTKRIASSVTLDYRINKAALPTGPLQVRHCWNCWAIVKLPIKIGRSLSEARLGWTERMRDALIGSSGCIPIKGEGAFSATCEMTGLFHLKKDPLPSGIYAIGRINFSGYVVDPDNPAVHDTWHARKFWKNSEKMCTQMTILLADLTTYTMNIRCRTGGRAGDPFRARLTLTDANGQAHPVPNARLKVLFAGVKGEEKEVNLSGEWKDDPATMVLMIPTGWYVAACPFDVARAQITASVAMALPGGKRETVTFSKTYEQAPARGTVKSSMKK